MLEEYTNAFIRNFIAFLPELIGAALLLIIGIWVIRLIMRFINRIMSKRNLDVSVAEFLHDIILWGLRIILIIAVISKLGIPTTSFIAALGAAGLAIGMALQGSLANFAGGVLIIIFKPFRVGDYITAQGVSGTVDEISIFTTKLITDTNQMAVIPNGNLSNDKVLNYSTLPHRREMMDIEIDYGENIHKAKEIILQIINKHPDIIKEGQPAPMVLVKELGKHGVILQLRYWTTTGDFWATRWDILEQIKKTLEVEDIKIPYEQKQIHIVNSPESKKA